MITCLDLTDLFFCFVDRCCKNLSAFPNVSENIRGLIDVSMSRAFIKKLKFPKFEESKVYIFMPLKFRNYFFENQ